MSETLAATLKLVQKARKIVPEAVKFEPLVSTYSERLVSELERYDIPGCFGLQPYRQLVAPLGLHYNKYSDIYGTGVQQQKLLDEKIIAHVPNEDGFFILGYGEAATLEHQEAGRAAYNRLWGGDEDLQSDNSIITAWIEELSMNAYDEWVVEPSKEAALRDGFQLIACSICPYFDRCNALTQNRDRN